MADSVAVIYQPLCIVSDFYNLEVIIKAKMQLLEDVSGLNIDDKLPHTPRRRDSVDSLLFLIYTSHLTTYLDMLL